MRNIGCSGAVHSAVPPTGESPRHSSQDLSVVGSVEPTAGCETGAAASEVEANGGAHHVRSVLKGNLIIFTLLSISILMSGSMGPIACFFLNSLSSARIMIEVKSL